MKRLTNRGFIVALLLVFSISMALAATEDRPALKKMLSRARSQITEVSVEQANQLLKTNKNIVLIDIRTKEEWNGGHIPGAVHLARGMLEFLVERKVKDKNQSILVYCRSGARGALGTLTLQKMGYTNVKNIAGAFLAWKKAGYAIEK